MGGGWRATVRVCRPATLDVGPHQPPPLCAPVRPGHWHVPDFLFVWANISNVISKRLEFTYKLEAAGKSKATSHTAILVRPGTEVY